MIDISTGAVRKNEMYSVKLNMDTASKEKIDNANKKLVQVLEDQGEILASERVQSLINEQHYNENTKPQESNTDELLEVNKKILSVLEQMMIQRSPSGEIPKSIRESVNKGKNNFNLGSGDVYINNSSSIWDLAGYLFDSIFNWKNFGIGGSGYAGKKMVLDKYLKKHPEVANPANDVAKKADKIKDVDIKSKKLNVVENVAENTKADKIAQEKSFADKIKDLKAMKSRASTRLLNNPITKGAVKAGKFASKFAKIIAPVVAVYSFAHTNEELGLEEDEVSLRTRLQNVLETTVNFATFGLVGESNIWLQSSQDITDYMPTEIRNGTLKEQIEYVEQFCIPYVQGIYGQDGLNPDVQTCRKILLRFNTWLDIKKREEKIKDGTASEEDKKLDQEIKTVIYENKHAYDVTGVSANPDDVLNQNITQSDLDSYVKTSGKDWYSNLSDQIIDKNIFSKDEILSWKDIGELDKSKVDYLRSTDNLSESSNLILDALVTNDDKNILNAVDTALLNQRRLLTNELSYDPLERDQDKIDEINKIISELEKQKKTINDELTNKGVIESLQKALEKNTETLDENQQRLSDVESAIDEQAKQEKEQQRLQSEEERRDQMMRSATDSVINTTPQPPKNNPHNFPNETTPSFSDKIMMSVNSGSNSLNSNISYADIAETPIPSIDFSNIKATGIPDDGTGDLGAYVKPFESGKRGASAIGYDSTGGTSYGSYQIATKVGTMNRALKFFETQGDFGKQLASTLRQCGNLDTGSTKGAGPEVWRRFAQLDGGKPLSKLEHAFIYNTHYKVAHDSLDPEIVKVIDDDRGLQEALWSTSVQHGPAGAKKIFTKTFDANQDNKTWIQKIYQLRGTQFGKSTAKVRNSVMNRYQSEVGIILGLSEGKGIPINAEVSQNDSQIEPPQTNTESPQTNTESPQTTSAESATESPSDSTTETVDNSEMENALETPISTAEINSQENQNLPTFEEAQELLNKDSHMITDFDEIEDEDAREETFINKYGKDMKNEIIQSAGEYKTTSRDMTKALTINKEKFNEYIKSIKTKKLHPNVQTNVAQKTEIQTAHNDVKNETISRDLASNQANSTSAVTNNTINNNSINQDSNTTNASDYQSLIDNTIL